MTRQKPEKLEKRAAALRENLRRRKPKSGQSGEEDTESTAKKAKSKTKSKE
ncbi:MAG: hypothetical protein KDI90_12135 [Alphaproteobacteria bacterium]|nr:hypothetical protein [Alphaproteobacteria bacterium]MCB9975608.1 hypothetical protein [Rhodospirillales bacterium]